jgi:hypothetical protein
MLLMAAHRVPGNVGAKYSRVQMQTAHHPDYTDICTASWACSEKIGGDCDPRLLWFSHTVTTHRGGGRGILSRQWSQQRDSTISSLQILSYRAFFNPSLVNLVKGFTQNWVLLLFILYTELR